MPNQVDEFVARYNAQCDEALDLVIQACAAFRAGGVGSEGTRLFDEAKALLAQAGRDLTAAITDEFLRSSQC